MQKLANLTASERSRSRITSYNVCYTKLLRDDIYRLAVNIEDETYLFEGIWPIPHGISINAYLIKGEKNVLIDLTQNIMDFPKAITGQMEGLSLAVEDIDIIVVNLV